MESVKYYFQPIHRPDLPFWSNPLLNTADLVDMWFSFGFDHLSLLRNGGTQNGKRIYEYTNNKTLPTPFGYTFIALKMTVVMCVVASILKDNKDLPKKTRYKANIAYSASTVAFVSGCKYWIRSTEIIRPFQGIASLPTETCEGYFKREKRFFKPLKSSAQLTYGDDSYKGKLFEYSDRLASFHLLRPTEMKNQVTRKSQCIAFVHDVSGVALLILFGKKLRKWAMLPLGILLDLKGVNRTVVEDGIRRSLNQPGHQGRRPIFPVNRLEQYLNKVIRPWQLSEEEQKKDNLAKWVQKWQCNAFFPVFAMGLDIGEISQFRKGDVEDRKVSITIGEETKQFSMSFIDLVPIFFSCLEFQARQSSQVQDFSITLSEDFGVTLDELEKIANNLNNPLLDWADEKDRTNIEFLCIQKDFPVQVLLDNFHNLADKHLDNYLSNPQFVQYLHSPPSSKSGSHLYNFISDGLDIPDGVNTKNKDIVLKVIDKIFNDLEQEHEKYCHINLLISEIFSNSLADSKDLIPFLLDLLEEKPQFCNYITILDFPFATDYSRLGELLGKTPNLLWLKTSHIEETTPFTIDSLPKLERLRVISIEDAKFTPSQIELLQSKMPNIEIFEVAEKVESFEEWLVRKLG